MASVSFFIRGKVADKESTIWAKFRDRDIDIRVPVPYLNCKPKDWKDGKCKIPSKKNHKDDTETINTRLAQLEANIISSYAEDKPELDLKEWLKSIIEPKSSKVEKASYSDDVVSFIDVYISLKKDSITESTVKKANVVKQLLQRYTDNKIKNDLLP